VGLAAEGLTMTQPLEPSEPPELLPLLSMATDPVQLRVEALDAAFRLHDMVGGLHVRPGVDREQTVALAEHAIRASAEVFAAWLAGTVRLALIRGEITHQETGVPTGTPNGGSPMQIHDNEEFDLSVDTKDAKGFETADQISWSIDRPDVLRLDVSEDSRSVTVVALAPGSAIITVSDDAAGLSATEAVDVLVGGTATIALAEGPVSVQE
jgi:hypothetical protein